MCASVVQREELQGNGVLGGLTHVGVTAVGHKASCMLSSPGIGSTSNKGFLGLGDITVTQ